MTSALLLLSLVFPKSRACARGGVPSPVHCRLKAGALFGAALFQLISTYVRRDVHSSPREGLSGAQRMLTCKGASSRCWSTAASTTCCGFASLPPGPHVYLGLRAQAYMGALVYVWAYVPTTRAPPVVSGPTCPGSLHPPRKDRKGECVTKFVQWVCFQYKFQYNRGVLMATFL